MVEFVIELPSIEFCTWNDQIAVLIESLKKNQRVGSCRCIASVASTYIRETLWLNLIKYPKLEDRIKRFSYAHVWVYRIVVDAWWPFLRISLVGVNPLMLGPPLPCMLYVGAGGGGGGDATGWLFTATQRWSTETHVVVLYHVNKPG